MLNYIAFILIALFIPAATLLGIRIHKPKTGTVTMICTWIFLGCELFRFFYNASLYRSNGAIQPSDKLTLTYLSILCAIAMLSRFNKGKIGNTLKHIFVFSALTPFVLGMFDPSVYINPDDTYTVVTALYFVETGFVFTLAMLYVLERKMNTDVKQLVSALVFIALYVGLNALARHFFTDFAFDLIWILSMVTIVAVTAAVGIALYFYDSKKRVTEIALEN